MKVLTTVAELRALPHDTRRGAVLTMGALHEGHASLMWNCRQEIRQGGILIVTIFVNPTQFSHQAAADEYPRDLVADIALCESQGIDYVFAPSVAEMYPTNQPVEQFSAGHLGEILEGVSRPEHFDAVATVVHRLLDVTEADVTCFGEKDYQQVAVVRQMVEQSGLDCEVITATTVREADGLAMSSRNRLLTAQQREVAAVIPQALTIVSEILETTGDPVVAVAAGKKLLETSPEAELDYLVVTNVELDSPPMTGAARVLIAVTIGAVRLIDNRAVTIGRS